MSGGTRTLHVPGPCTSLTRGEPWRSRGGPHGCLGTGRGGELSTTYTGCRGFPWLPALQAEPTPDPGHVPPGLLTSPSPRHPLLSPNASSSSQPSGKPHPQALMAPTAPISGVASTPVGMWVDGGRTQVCAGLPCKTHPPGASIGGTFRPLEPGGPFTRMVSSHLPRVTHLSPAGRLSAWDWRGGSAPLGRAHHLPRLTLPTLPGLPPPLCHVTNEATGLHCGHLC